MNFSRPQPSGTATAKQQISQVLRDADTRPIGFDQRVADNDHVRVMLDLEVGSEPIVGSMQAHGRRVDFSGWVGLAIALEQAISAAEDGSPQGRIAAHSDGVSQLP